MIDNLVDQAIVAAKAGNWKEARNLLSRAVQIDPKNARAWYLLSQVFEESDRIEFCLKRVLEIDPNNEQATEKLRILKAKQSDSNVWVSHSRNSGWPIYVTLIGILMVCMGLSGWYYFYGPCGVTLVKASKEELAPLLVEFTDAENVAMSTSRIALAGPVAELQRIRRKIELVKVPTCMEDARSLMVESMNYEIEAYMLFMQDSYGTQKQFELAKTTLEAASLEIERVLQCAPFCVGGN